MLTKADSKDIEPRSEKSNTGNKHLNHLKSNHYVVQRRIDQSL